MKELIKWKQSNTRKPLIIRGARQVGKTTLVRQFSEKYKQYIYLNLEKPEHKHFFEALTDVREIVDALLLRFELLPDYRNTLLFIDEIQESPKALALLRYFYEDLPDLHVITAGSLLEFSLGAVSNFPVGRVQYMYLFPINFREFLLAMDKKGALNAFDDIPLTPSAQDILMEYFHVYAIIGGMPEVVQQYTATETVAGSGSIYEGIWSSYRNDVRKYAKSPSEEKVIYHIINTAHNYLDQRVTFQNFANSNYRSREVGEAFRSLDDAKVIQLIYPTTDIEFPIKPDFQRKPRMQFLDIGLVNFALNIQHELIGLNDLSEAYRGALVPQIVMQELISNNTTYYQKPQFWVRKKTQSSAEVDLVLYHSGMVIPIEIKSGKSGKLRSLHQFMEISRHPYAVRLYAGKLEVVSTKTPSGKKFLLLNLPYCLGSKLNEYIGWFTHHHFI